MLSKEQRESILKYNQEIIDAIHVSRLTEHEGFAILERFLKEQRHEAEYGSIIGIDSKVLESRQLLIEIFDLIFAFIGECKRKAIKPKKDIETGDFIPLRGDNNN